MVDLTPFIDGINAARKQQVIVSSDPRSDFERTLSNYGFKNIGQIAVGRLTRITGVEDKGAKKSGWYIYNEIEDSRAEGHIIGIASYGDWKTNLNETWSSRSLNQMNRAELNNYNLQREAMRVAYEAEVKAKNERAALKAYEVWSNAPDANEHEYLTKKQVSAYQGVKQGSDGRLIVPMAYEGQIVSLQYIAPDSSKRFLSGGRIKGAWFMIEGAGDTVYVSEGYSTGASVHEATGATVYIAFNANNIYEVASYAKRSFPLARLIIAGDDDFENEINIGRQKAEQAASGLSIECVFPQGFIDFNDMHTAQGLESVSLLLNTKIKETYKKKDKGALKDIDRPSGVLGEMFDYYNATSGNKQHGFAIQTALAICSVVIGRKFKTNFDNYASLYFLNVGKSGTGKEHTKTVVEQILHAADMSHLIAGDGYTSAGAVFSGLLDRPKHISIIDEFGRYLEAGKSSAKGTHHQREANTKIMEAFGRAHSVLRPPTYSTMTLKKDAAKELRDRMIYNPSLTLLTMTTPSTLFQTLDMAAIKDGFVNRFLIHISDAKREVRRHKPPIDVPISISNWCNIVDNRNGRIFLANEPVEAVTIPLSQGAEDAQFEFQQYCIDLANELDAFGMAEITSRANEVAMRMSLIYALSENPDATIISRNHIEWCIKYVKMCLNDTIDRLKFKISHSEFEQDKKQVLQALRDIAPQGITWSQMQKEAPYSAHRPKDLKEILEALKDAELIGDEQYKPTGGGRPSIRWVALK
jgi:phage/plasmid primase-like uncharacterized protein